MGDIEERRIKLEEAYQLFNESQFDIDTLLLERPNSAELIEAQ